MEHDKTFIIPSDYGCLAIVDPSRYQSFVSECWTLEQLLAHFISQSIQGAMVAWGCVSGNWRVLVSFSSEPECSGFREIRSKITSSGSLLLTNYDSLTMAAQFHDVVLPETHDQDNLFAVPAGAYTVRVIQLFDPEKAESEEVFNQVAPHFRLELLESCEGMDSIDKIAWFAEINCV